MSNWKEKITAFAGRTGLKLKKYSPEISLAVGLVSFVGTVVVACKQTLKAEDTVHFRLKKIEEIHEEKEASDNQVVDENGCVVEYSDELYKKDLQIQYGKLALEVARDYAPVIALGAISLTCIIVSRNITHKRYLNAVAAFNAVSAAFNEYRQRVIEEEGEVMDRHYRYGTEIETVKVAEIDENGNVKEVEKKMEKTGTGKIPADDTARFFSEGNPRWDRNPEFSMMFLRAQQNFANDILRTRGHIFLNEVYDMLGFSHTQAGAILGWVKGMGDDFVDFGLYDPQKAKDFVNGNDDSILLEFNHDGPIWDKI